MYHPSDAQYCNLCIWVYAFCTFRSWGSYQSTVCSPWCMACPSIGWPGLTRLQSVSCSTSCWCGWWCTAAEPWLCLSLLRCPPCRSQPSWAIPCSPSSTWLEVLSSTWRTCGLVRRWIQLGRRGKKKRCCSGCDAYTCVCFSLLSGLVDL